VAVQDTGWWLTAELTYHADGNLSGMQGAEVAPMLDARGQPLEGRAADAEGLTVAPGNRFGGDVLVSFEHQHRVDRYPFGTRGFLARPGPVLLPAAVKQSPANGGMEAITTLADGSLLILTELYADEEGHLHGWLLRGDRFDDLRLERTDLFAASDLATLPGGDAVVLERLFYPRLARAARLRRIPAAAIRPGALLKGTELATLSKGFTVDNMEALAVRVDEKGKVFLYLASDDSGSPSQRTLLLLFELRDDGPNGG
jgi:hypothetical protein